MKATNFGSGKMNCETIDALAEVHPDAQPEVGADTEVGAEAEAGVEAEKFMPAAAVEGSIAGAEAEAGVREEVTVWKRMRLAEIGSDDTSDPKARIRMDINTFLSFTSFCAR